MVRLSCVCVYVCVATNPNQTACRRVILTSQDGFPHQFPFLFVFIVLGQPRSHSDKFGRERLIVRA